MRLPWAARRSDKSILKEINPEYSLERLFMKLKLQYFGYLMRRANSLKRLLSWERLKGKWQRRRWIDSITYSMFMNFSKVWEIMVDRGAWCAAVYGVAKSQT